MAATILPARLFVGFNGNSDVMALSCSAAAIAGVTVMSNASPLALQNSRNAHSETGPNIPSPGGSRSPAEDKRSWISRARGGSELIVSRETPVRERVTSSSVMISPVFSITHAALSYHRAFATINRPSRCFAGIGWFRRAGMRIFPPTMEEPMSFRITGLPAEDFAPLYDQIGRAHV